MCFSLYTSDEKGPLPIVDAQNEERVLPINVGHDFELSARIWEPQPQPENYFICRYLIEQLSKFMSTILVRMLVPRNIVEIFDQQGAVNSPEALEPVLGTVKSANMRADGMQASADGPQRRADGVEVQAQGLSPLAQTFICSSQTAEAVVVVCRGMGANGLQLHAKGPKPNADGPEYVADGLKRGYGPPIVGVGTHDCTYLSLSLPAGPLAATLCKDAQMSLGRALYLISEF